MEIGQELGIGNAIFVGHSVGAMMGVFASEKASGMISKLVLVGPSTATLTTVTTGAASRASK
ncbi:alpha/beta fold hydrolase [Rhizobium acidisoli]|uniref:alpha/beta fold hydrolase n=1 Tax=Rhizobium acidisoli TaxID=1538158 RepID=UPI0006BA684C